MATSTDKKPAAKRPAAAKAPQDHKPKGPETVDITLGTGDDARTVQGKRITIDGITVDIADEALDDFEITIALGQLQEGDPQLAGAAFPRIFTRLLGTDANRVLRELRDPDSGRVTNERAGNFINAIFEALNPNS